MIPSFRSLVRNWWMAALWLGVILLESTDMASASNTSTLLYTVIHAVSPNVDRGFVEVLDEVLRKTGHFVGYGILGALVFLALRNTNRDRIHKFLPRSWGIHLRDLWRMEWAVIGVLATIATATYDELHQSFIPSRTGRWQDVILDTGGAVVLQVLIYFLSKRALKLHQAEARHPQLTAVR